MTKNNYIREWEIIIKNNGNKVLIENELVKSFIFTTSFETNQFAYRIKLKGFKKQIDIPAFILENLVIMGEKDDSIVLILKNETLLDVFYTLSFEIHQILEKSKSHEELLSGVGQIITKYIYLFKKKKPNEISKIIGLYGELLFIRKGIDEGKKEMISSWFGPDGNRHDFSCEDTSVEIKSAYSKKGIATISNSLQLMVEPPENLYLAYFFFDHKYENEDSLHEIIRSIFKDLPDNDKLMFANKLSEVDITFNEDYTLSDPIKIELLIDDYFAVLESFPKLTTQNIPTGVNNVKYEILLSTVSEECIINIDTIWKHLK